MCLDIQNEEFEDIFSAGFEDYSVIPVDIDKKDDAYSPALYDSLRGIRMPDGIAVFEIDGTDYLITANEGDAQEWGDEDSGTFYISEDERDFADGDSSPTGRITASLKERSYFSKVGTLMALMKIRTTTLAAGPSPFMRSPRPA